MFFLLLSGCQKNINENFEKISYLEFQEKIQKNEEFYIIFERDDCPACPVFLEKFNQVSGENNLSFFVIDTNELNSKQKYECKDKSYTYNDSNKTCSKRVTSTITAEGCPRGYKQEGSKCNKYSTTKVKANTKKITSTSYKYMWSKSESVDGWTKTGKTRTVDGKEICE